MSKPSFFDVWVNTVWSVDNKHPPAVTGVNTCYHDAMVAAKQTLKGTSGLKLVITAYRHNDYETYVDALERQKKHSKFLESPENKESNTE